MLLQNHFWPESNYLMSVLQTNCFVRHHWVIRCLFIPAPSVQINISLHLIGNCCTWSIPYSSAGHIPPSCTTELQLIAGWMTDLKDKGPGHISLFFFFSLFLNSVMQAFTATQSSHSSSFSKPYPEDPQKIRCTEINLQIQT